MTSTQKVVIVGAGASARVVAKTLKENKANVHITVVQPNKFASLPWYQTRVLTKKDTLDNNSTFDAIPGSDKMIYGVAIACSDGILAVQPLDEKTGSVTANAEPLEIPFDTLVAATGTKFPVVCETPGQSKEERQAEINKISTALFSGSHVVIAGGGATGIELVADIMESLPAEKRKGSVTFVCSSDRLLKDQPEYYGGKAKEVLESLGATVIFNDRVTSHSETTVAESGSSVNLTLKSGKTLKCGVYVAAFAQGANSSWLKTPFKDKGLPKGIVSEKGRVKVNEYMQSASYEKLYGVAAVTDRKEPALAMNVEAQAKTVAANIKTPKSTKVTDGVMSPVYQMIGGETFVMFMPENMPMPPACSTLCCTWCGFPFNLLCPCFLCGVLCGPVDPMTCGYCCSRPEGKGGTNTLKNVREMGVLAKNMDYVNIGQGAPSEHAMER